MFIPVLGRSPGEKMATHSSILAWRIPWTEEPSRLQSIDHKDRSLGRRLGSHWLSHSDLSLFLLASYSPSVRCVSWGPPRAGWS